MLKSLFPSDLRTPAQRLEARKAGRKLPSLRTPATPCSRGEDTIWIPTDLLQGLWTSNPVGLNTQSLRHLQSRFNDAYVWRGCLDTLGYYLDDSQYETLCFGIAKVGPDCYCPAVIYPWDGGALVFFKERFTAQEGRDDLNKYVESARHEAQKRAEESCEDDRKWRLNEAIEEAKLEIIESFTESRSWIAKHRQLPEDIRQADYPASLLEQRLEALRADRRKLRASIKKTLADL